MKLRSEHSIHNVIFIHTGSSCCRWMCIVKAIHLSCIAINYIIRLHHFSGTFTLQFLEEWDALCFSYH